MSTQKPPPQQQKTPQNGGKFYRRRRGPKTNPPKTQPPAAIAGKRNMQRELTKDQKIQAKKAKMLATAVGMRGVAPIVSVNKGQDSLLTVPQAQLTVLRKVIINERTLHMAALGVILRAIQRGASYPDIDLYQAYLYLSSVLLAAVKGEKVDAIELPAFCWEIVAALGPKKVGFKTGEISFSSTVTQPADVTYKTKSINYQVLGTTKFLINLGAVSISGSVNGFPILEQGAAPLDPTVGAQSLGAIWVALGIKRLWTLQAYAPSLKNDASTYAAVVSQFGSTLESVGGLRTCVSSEVFVACPILAKFSLEDPESSVLFQTKRGFWQYRPSSGGPLYVLSRASEFRAQRQWRNKATPFFKFYDFWDLFERFSCWLGRIFEQSTVSTTTTPLPVYPLTAQQAAIILRYTVMKVFSNYMGADLDMSSEFSDLVSVTAWAPGQQTPMRAGVSMKLPSFMAENIRSIRRMIVPTPFGDVDTIPILGGAGDYYNEQFTWQNGENAVPIYQAITGIPINLVDCTVNENNVVSVLSLDGVEMSNLINAHNAWTEKVSDYTSPLCDIGEESGTCLLAPNYQTIMQQVVITLETPQPVAQPVVLQSKDGNTSTVRAPTIKRDPSRAKLHRGKRFETAQVGEPTPVGPIGFSQSNNGVIGYTLLMNPMAAAWKYQKLQWCPVRVSNHGTSINEENIAWYRTNMAEPVYISSSAQQVDTLITGENFTFTTVHQRNLAAANIDIKSPLGTNEWINDFKTLAINGDGGLIKVLGNLLGNALGIQEVKDVAEGIDGFMPF